MLILAGVSLSFVFNGGILDKAQLAVNKYQESSVNEQEILNSIDKYLSEEIGGSSGGEEPENPDSTPEEPEQDGIQVGDVVTAEDIVKVEDKSDIYGATVNGYDCENNAGVESWKLFYADNENVYLIASNYINKNYCPNGIGGTPITDHGNGYKLSMDDIINDYNGASDITDERIKKLNEDYFNKYGSENSTSYNMKVVAYMLDTSEEVWGKFAGDKAKYAIGGPTLELLFKSYNEKYNTNNKYQAQAEDEYGYQISSDGGENFGYAISDYLNAADDLYVIDETNNASAMWVASPSAYLDDFVYEVHYDGYVDTVYYFNTYKVGFRPLVCLQSNVQLEKQQDGSFLLK